MCDMLSDSETKGRSISETGMFSAECILRDMGPTPPHTTMTGHLFRFFFFFFFLIH